MKSISKPHKPASRKEWAKSWCPPRLLVGLQSCKNTEPSCSGDVPRIMCDGSSHCPCHSVVSGQIRPAALLEAIGNIPPVEFEMAYYRQQKKSADAVDSTKKVSAATQNQTNNETSDSMKNGSPHWFVIYSKHRNASKSLGFCAMIIAVTLLFQCPNNKRDVGHHDS